MQPLFRNILPIVKWKPFTHESNAQGTTIPTTPQFCNGQNPQSICQRQLAQLLNELRSPIFVTKLDTFPFVLLVGGKNVP